jgi:hypothetical protein
MGPTAVDTDAERAIAVGSQSIARKALGVIIERSFFHVQEAGQVVENFGRSSCFGLQEETGSLGESLADR